MKKLWIVTFLAIAVVTAHAQEPNEPPDAQQIETLLLKRFPGMNRVLWLDGNTIDFGNQKGASPHKQITGWTCKVLHNPPRISHCNRY